MINLNTVIGKFNDTKSIATTGIDQYQEKSLIQFKNRLLSKPFTELVQDFKVATKPEKLIILSILTDRLNETDPKKSPEIYQFLKEVYSDKENKSLLIELKDLAKKDSF
jgi:hypothetical protein